MAVIDAPAEVEQYTPISLESVCADTILDFDLFIENPGYKHRDEGDRFILYREQNLPMEDWQRQRLIESGVDRLFIKSNDQKSYYRYLESNLARILSDKKIEIPQKAHMAYEAAAGLVQDVFTDPSNPKSIQRAIQLVNNTIGFTLSGKDIVHQFISTMGRDYSTYTHCVNVCLYSLALAKRVNVRDDELAGVSLGGLLHDIGKHDIDNSILQKPGPLTSEEWVIMKHHPSYGINILKKFPRIPDIAYRVVYEHHEKCDGSGYPDGLRAEQINPYAKIMCLADVFDALTTNRPYKKKISTYSALQIMRDNMKGAFDQNLWRQFTMMLGKE
ncbi:MAG: HD-GYP domain-containing protein [Phycisphaerae bacterium]